MLSRFKRKKADNFIPAVVTRHIENEPVWWMNNGRVFCDKKYWGDVGVYRVLWRGKRGRVILNGPVPCLESLLVFSPETALEIVLSDYGDVSRYDNGFVILRFTNCEVGRKWIPVTVAWRPEQQEQLKLYVEIECDIEIVLNG